MLGKALLAGVELLVAADIIRTVALEPTLPSIGALALLMVVRTFLGWTVTLEVEGRWPWQVCDRQPERDWRGPRLPPGGGYPKFHAIPAGLL